MGWSKIGREDAGVKHSRQACAASDTGSNIEKYSRIAYSCIMKTTIDISENLLNRA
jgi:hypothetical protein